MSSIVTHHKISEYSVNIISQQYFFVQVKKFHVGLKQKIAL